MESSLPDTHMRYLAYQGKQDRAGRLEGIATEDFFRSMGLPVMHKGKQVLLTAILD